MMPAFERIQKNSSFLAGLLPPLKGSLLQSGVAPPLTYATRTFMSYYAQESYSYSKSPV